MTKLGNAGEGAASDSDLDDGGTDRFPASFAQRAIYRQARDALAGKPRHIVGAWRIGHELDASALQAALDDLVERHETLRTGFEADGDASGEPMQVVHGDARLALRSPDLKERDSAASGSAGQPGEGSDDEAFDLTRPPLARACLLRRMGADEQPGYELRLTLHRLVADGESIAVLLRDLRESYAARRAGRTPALPVLEIQYADYAAWQREHWQGAVLQASLAHWRQALDGAPPGPALPCDVSSGPRPSRRPASLAWSLDVTLSRRLGVLAAAQGADLSMVLLAGWAAMLARRSGQDSLCIGYPVSGRERPELRNVVGPFANVLVVRLEFPPDQTAEALIRQVRDAVRMADRHRDLPFELLAAEIDPAGFGTRALFSTFFAFDNADLDAVAADAHVESAVHWRPEGPALHGELVFDADRFEHGGASQLAQSLQALLCGMVDDIASPVATLPLLGRDEQAALRARQRDPASAVGSVPFVHQQFAAQARNRPDAPAVAFGDDRLNYGELLERVDVLATLLRTAGVGPERLVAVGLGRNIGYVVAILAILQSGGAYVVLDVAGPLERELDALDDTGADWVVTDAAHVETYRSRPGIQAFVVSSRDGDLIGPGRSTGHAIASAAFASHPDHLAYCLYTSGSTGRPKGALNTHGGLGNLAAWFFSERLATEPGERVLMASDVTFDLSQKSVLATLAHGGLVVIPDGDVTDADAVHAAIARHRPTRISCAPSAYRAYGLPTPGTSIRTVVLGGEPIDPDLAARIRQCGLHLVNSYGPTECADISASHLARAGDDAAWAVQPLPIGRAIPNTRIYLLDEALEPVPPGVVGEIHIAGASVGRGYLRRPGQTAERFLPDPFGLPGSRMYATGDLGRMRGDGGVDYLGRRDSQVKIRGIRVEIGEIEAALRRCNGVADAAIVARTDERGSTALLACVVPCEDFALEFASLRDALAARLPSYLVPTAWTQLAELPLNRSGKLDRRALARLAPNARVPDADLEPPATPTERILHRLWCELLGTPAIGRHDNFFAMGGHSLMAMTLAGRLRSECDVHAAVSDCLNAVSLADLGARIDAGVATSADAQPLAST